MTQVLINIQEDNVSLVKMLVEKLGGDFEIKKEEKATAKKGNGKKKAAVEEIEEIVSPTYLYGKWKDTDIDPKTWRREVWRRKK